MQLAPVQNTGTLSPPPPRPALPPAQPSAIAAVEDVLDLSSGSRNIIGNYRALSPEEQVNFLETLATLLKQGVIGTETKEVNGRPYQSFVSIGFADPVVRDAPTYRDNDTIRPRLDVKV